MKRKIGSTQQICSVTRSQVTDGRAKGARLIHVSNGCLSFVLSESNALDIPRLWHKGVNVGFLSRNGLYTGEGGFMHDFPAGMMYTCGFDAIGGVEGHRPHGRLHTIPAEIVEIRADEESVKIVAEVRDTQLFGENLVLTRTIETGAFANEIVITDSIRNESFRDEKYAMLYHVNVGYPFVDEGAKIEANVVRTLPRNDWAAKCAKTMFKVEAPVDNFEENCFFHETKDGRMSLVNRKIRRRFTVESSLKKFVQWKSRASGDYVIGLEPCTSWLDDHLKYSVLKPGDQAVHRLVLRCEDF